MRKGDVWLQTLASGPASSSAWEKKLFGEKNDRQQTNVKPRENGTINFNGISLSMEYVGVLYNTECEFLFLAGLIIGRTSFLSLEALLSHKHSIFKESKRKIKKKEREKKFSRKLSWWTNASGRIVWTALSKINYKRTSGVNIDLPSYLKVVNNLKVAFMSATNSWTICYV